MHRTMTKKELATLYFPHLNPLKASDALARWIARAPTLKAALEQTGYEKTMRTLTPRQVELITTHFGDP